MRGKWENDGELRPLSLNERRLIELVASHGTLARVDLARHSGMTGASVTRLISGLLDLGIFREKPDRRGATGQPKRLLSINAGAFHAAGLTFSLRSMEVVIIDLSGATIAGKSIELSGFSAGDVASAGHDSVASMLAELSIPDTRLIGVGCSMPGNFDPTGNLLRAHELFRDFDGDRAVRLFAEQFGARFLIENDGSAAALGEHIFGQSSDDGDGLFFIHIGHGIGGGAIVDGRLFRGVHGNAGLPGVLFPYDQPRPSGQDLLRYLSDCGVAVEDFDQLEGLSGRDRRHLDRWVTRAGDQLRHVVRVVSGFFDPSVIVIGGRLPEDINEQLADTVKREPIDGPSRGLPIAPVRASRLGPRASAVGAACIPLFSTFFSGSVWDAGNPYLNGRRPLAPRAR